MKISLNQRKGHHTAVRDGWSKWLYRGKRKSSDVTIDLQLILNRPPIQFDYLVGPFNGCVLNALIGW